jgi:hypothetical protein
VNRLNTIESSAHVIVEFNDNDPRGQLIGYSPSGVVCGKDGTLKRVKVNGSRIEF